LNSASIYTNDGTADLSAVFCPDLCTLVLFESFLCSYKRNAAENCDQISAINASVNPAISSEMLHIFFITFFLEIPLDQLAMMVFFG
jgi:hypothetical protein